MVIEILFLSRPQYPYPLCGLPSQASQGSPGVPSLTCSSKNPKISLIEPNWLDLSVSTPDPITMARGRKFSEWPEQVTHSTTVTQHRINTSHSTRANRRGTDESPGKNWRTLTRRSSQPTLLVYNILCIIIQGYYALPIQKQGIDKSVCEYED